ncbi:MAG TPA: sulfotransferase [Dongiaceae bacterium]|nr:sulfotransferase [Dongiaceae bacterium]
MGQGSKTFLLGLGCQKGGSTWLFNYLSRLPDCNFGLAKEYHTFDARHLDEFRWFHTRNLHRLSRLLEKKRHSGFWPSRALDRRIEGLSRKIIFCNDPTFYADYFDALWENDPAAHLVGDITPGYAALGPEHFREIKQLLEAKGFDIKVVFLMRDPVERCYSATRSPFEKKIRRGAAVDVLALLEENYASPGFECRTRYEATIEALESVFRPEQLFFGLYESFFCMEEIGRLNWFLGIGGNPRPDLNRRVNASQRDVDVPTDLAARIFAHYRPTYDFCAARFGTARLRAAWRHY